MPVCGYVVKSLVWTVESAAQKFYSFLPHFCASPAHLFLRNLPADTTQGKPKFPLSKSIHRARRKSLLNRTDINTLYEILLQERIQCHERKDCTYDRCIEQSVL